MIEITKGNIATEETKHFIDTNKMILDVAKIDQYVEMLSESLISLYEE